MWSLAVGTLEDSVGAGLASDLACGANMESGVVVTSTQLASDFLPADCRVVSIALASIALAIGLGVSVGCTTCLDCSNQ